LPAGDDMDVHGCQRGVPDDVLLLFCRAVSDLVADCSLTVLSSALASAGSRTARRCSPVGSVAGAGPTCLRPYLGLYPDVRVVVADIYSAAHSRCFDGYTYPRIIAPRAPESRHDVLVSSCCVLIQRKMADDLGSSDQYSR